MPGFFCEVFQGAGLAEKRPAREIGNHARRPSHGAATSSGPATEVWRSKTRRMAMLTVRRSLATVLPAVGLWLLATLIGAEDGFSAQKAPDTIQWQVQNTRVVSGGTVVSEVDGTLVAGYVIEGDAVSLEEFAPVRQGRIVLELRIYSPAQDRGAQRAGRWYISGDWSITDPSAGPPPDKARHSSSVVKGTIVGSFAFNPALERRNINARLQMTSAGGHSFVADGVLATNGRYEGTLTFKKVETIGMLLNGTRRNP
jgi:hypothetical protein